MSTRNMVYGAIAAGLIAAIAISWQFSSSPRDDGGPEITFLDEVTSNDVPSAKLIDFQFTTPDGQPLTLRDSLNKKCLVVVVLRGNTGAICPYCSTQTSRLIANYNEFVRRDSEVVVIYPVEKEEDRGALTEFLRVTRERLAKPSETVPFPLVLDIGLQAVDELGLRAFLSKPATYILDKQGNVRFAYVGESLADRPSVKALLQQVDALGT